MTGHVDGEAQAHSCALEGTTGHADPAGADRDRRGDAAKIKRRGAGEVSPQTG